MLRRIDDLLEAEETFSLETTLATKSYINLVRRAHAKGYLVHLLFFWLENTQLAKQRVATRVANGGHNIAEEVIERRYVAGLKNLFSLFTKEVDVWSIYDNSYNLRERIAFGGAKIPTVIKDKSKFETIKEYVRKRS